MGEFKNNSVDVEAFTDSCGTQTELAIKVGGGTEWGIVYKKAFDNGRGVVGGGGLTVGAAGGWLMGGGLSALSRYGGYGVDNVLAVEVVTSNAEVIVADACNHEDLFWALRGGGGGTFGVTTAVYYKTYPLFPLTVLQMGIDNSLFPVAMESWIDFWVDISPTLPVEWTGGYWTTSGISQLFFKGTEAEARATFIDSLEAWKAGLGLDSADQEKVQIVVYEVPSYWQSRTDACYDDSGNLIQNPSCLKYGAATDETGSVSTTPKSRMAPRDFVTKNGGAQAKETLKWILHNGGAFNYFLGGNIANVAGNATAIHPSVRDSLWNIFVGSDEAIARLRSDITDAGVCLNHAGQADEPDWETAAWGTNYPRLKQIKEKYDPDNRFNCFHCVGYEPLGDKAATPTTCNDEFNCLETEVQYCELCEAPMVTWMSPTTYDFGNGPEDCFGSMRFVAFNPYQIPEYSCSENVKNFFRNTTCCPAPTSAPTSTPAPTCSDDDAQIAALAAENGFSTIKSCADVQNYCSHPIYGEVVSRVCSITCLTDKDDILAEIAQHAGFPHITSCSQVSWLCNHSKNNDLLTIFHSWLCGYTCNCIA